MEPMYAFDIHCNGFFPVILFFYFGNVSSDMALEHSFAVVKCRFIERATDSFLTIPFTFLVVLLLSIDVDDAVWAEQRLDAGGWCEHFLVVLHCSPAQ